MSHHAIEQLIEETTLLIDAAELPDTSKRDYLAGVFKIQHYYDTGYIHFRVIEILLKYGFVYRIPLESYPSYEKQKISIPGWMENETTGELAYAKEESGEKFLYVDAGSISWNILCEHKLLTGSSCQPLTPIPLPGLIGDLMEEAQKQQNKILLTQWYGLFVNCYLDSTFGTAEGFPASFPKLIQDKGLLRVRSIAQANLVKRLRNEDEALIIPLLADEISLAGDEDKKYAARFFLELKKTPEAIYNAYQHATQKRNTSSDKIDIYISGQLTTGLAASGWELTIETEKNQWCWYRDTSSGRRFLWVNYEEKDKFLMAHLGLQHHLLLKWQGREADTSPEHIHFYQMAVASLPEERQESKFTNELGGWKFDITKTDKLLKTQIARLIEDLQLATENYFSYLDTEFPESYFKRDPDRLLHLMEEGEDETGIVPDYVLFTSGYSILLCFLYRVKENGENINAATTVQKIAAKLNSRENRSSYETKYLEPFLSNYEKNPDETPMPLLNHYLLLKKIMRDK